MRYSILILIPLLDKAFREVLWNQVANAYVHNLWADFYLKILFLKQLPERFYTL